MNRLEDRVLLFKPEGVEIMHSCRGPVVILEDEHIEIDGYNGHEVWKYIKYLELRDYIKIKVRNGINYFSGLENANKIKDNIKNIKNEIDPYLIDVYGTKDIDELRKISNKEEKESNLHPFFKKITEQAFSLGLR